MCKSYVLCGNISHAHQGMPHVVELFRECSWERRVESDGVVVKKVLSAEQIWNLLRSLANAIQVVDFLEEKYTEQVYSSYKQTKLNRVLPLSCVFWLIGEKEVAYNDRSIYCNTLP